MNLLIIGAPGSGKGTVSESIISTYDIVHISTGDMLRQAVKDETALGVKAKEYMSTGQLVPDAIINDMIVERLSKDDINKGFLFDGYPRTLSQAESLTEILNKMDKKIDAVIELDIADEQLIKRITGRRICLNCGEIYNIYFKAPITEEICNKCGSKLTKRSDDNEESLKVRLNEYHHNTEPVIQYYDKMNIVNKVNADQDKLKVFMAVNEILEGIK